MADFVFNAIKEDFAGGDFTGDWAAGVDADFRAYLIQTADAPSATDATTSAAGGVLDTLVSDTNYDGPVNIPVAQRSVDVTTPASPVLEMSGTLTFASSPDGLGACGLYIEWNTGTGVPMLWFDTVTVDPNGGDITVSFGSDAVLTVSS